MEKVFGRYVATARCISGIYAAEYGDSEVINAVRKRTEAFAEKEGRRPRILVTKMGQAMTAASKSLPQPLQTWVLMWISAPCSRRLKKLRKWQWKMMFTW